MLTLRGMQRVCILGGGTAGWFAALYLRQIFSPSVEIMVISAQEIPIVGVGEGGVLNFIGALEKLKIPLLEFIKETEAVHKLGFYIKGRVVIFII
jgi:tryptophan halogenase